MATNYKSCPLKKRPIVYEQEAEVRTLDTLSREEQPQDLSLKRPRSALEDASDDCHYEALPKRDCVLNLSKSGLADREVLYRPESPLSVASDLSASSALLSPKADVDPSCIHLRGMTAATTAYTTNPYQSAFVLAAGCNPMSALWSSYQPTTVGSIFPSPASSVASSACSPHSLGLNLHHQHQHQHQQAMMTPPSSPSSDISSEPEDLSVRNDIPLPALFHYFDEAPTSTTSHSPSPTSPGTTPFRRAHHVPYVGSPSRGSSIAGTDAVTSAAKSYRFKCEKCSKMYSTAMGLSKHQQFHCPAAEANQEKKQHACQDCGKLYTTIGALKMHIRTHTLPCKCPICGKAFSRPWLLQGHIRTHTGEKPFQCPDCPRSFADRSNLRAHQQTHVDVKKYACKVCHKSFSRMSLLNKHASSNCTITIA